MNLPAFVQSGVDLSACNTLALPCRAAHYARLETRAQLTELAGSGLPAGCRRFVLGGGSNLVLPSEFDGLVVHMAVIGRELAGEDAGSRVVVRPGRAWPIGGLGIGAGHAVPLHDPVDVFVFN